LFTPQSLSDADRGQRLNKRLPGLMRGLARRYSDWNWGWRVDIALRYVPVERALAGAGLLSADARMLDVGCGSKGGLTSYVPARTIGVDLHFNLGRVRRHERVTPLVGSGLALPLAAGSFDAVLCMDTLEHLAPAGRRALLAELFRVVRDRGLVIAGAPCGEDARAAELRIDAAYRLKTGQDHPWLAEHLAHEPLTRDSLRALMQTAASRRFAHFELELVPNTSLWLWELLQQEGGLRHLHRPLLQPLWPLIRNLHEPPVYRQVAVVRVAGKNLNSATN